MLVGGRIPLAASARRSVGTPMMLGGIRRISPRTHSPAPVAAGYSRSSMRPTLRASPIASGRVACMASAPSSSGTPATGLTLSLPPSWDEDSSSVTRIASPPSDRSRCAAANPAMPPPTTTTCAPATRPLSAGGSGLRSPLAICWLVIPVPCHGAGGTPARGSHRSLVHSQRNRRPVACVPSAWQPRPADCSHPSPCLLCSLPERLPLC